MDPVEAKMSKSSPGSAVFMHDSPEEIAKKLRGAFCPPEVEGNPVLDLVQLLVFPKQGSIHIDRSAKYGGPISYSNYDELKEAYVAGKLHPQDLKKGAAESLVQILGPVREYFVKHPRNLEKVRELSITR